MNSSYGKLMEDVTRHTQCKIARFEDIKTDWLSPLMKNIEQIEDHNIFEINSMKRRVDDSKLTHCGLAVLHMSKVQLMGYIYWLEEMLTEGAYKILYLGKF